LEIKFIRQDLTNHSGLELIRKYFQLIKLNYLIKDKMRDHKINRPGNVHDNNDSDNFVKELVADFKKCHGSRVRLQIRHDGGFFSSKNFEVYEEKVLDYVSKVPFWRYPIFKKAIVENEKWGRINSKVNYFFKDLKRFDFLSFIKQKLLVTLMEKRL